MLAVIWDKSGSQNTFQYRLDWCSPVCRDAFCAVIGISCRTLKHWLQQVCSDSDVEPHPHGNCGRSPHNALSRLDKNRVVSFIRNYATHTCPSWSWSVARSRQRLCSGEWQDHEVSVCRVLQGHGIPSKEHTSSTTTMPLPTDQSTEKAVHLAQCPSSFTNTTCSTCCEVCVIYLTLSQVLHHHIDPTIMQWPVW